MILAQAFGIAVFFGLIYYALKSNAHMWSLVAADYAAKQGLPPAIASKAWEDVVIAGSGVLKFRKYLPLTVRIHETGLSLTALAPLAPIQPTLFLPFEDIAVRPTYWYINAESYALRLAGLNEPEIIVHDRLMDWLRANCEHF